MGLAISALIVCGLLYLSKSRQKDKFKEKIIFIGFASLFIGFAVNRIFLFLGDFLVPGSFINYTFYGDFNKTNPAQEYFLRSGLIAYNGGFIIFIFGFEMNIKRIKYILTLIQASIAMLYIFSSDPILQQITVTYNIIIFIVIIFFYTKWSDLQYKAISTYILGSFGLIIAGIAYAAIPMKQVNKMPLFLPPLLIIFGAIFAIIPLFIDPLNLQRAFLYIVIDILIIIYTLIFFILSILFGINIGYIVAPLIVLIFFIYLEHYRIKEIKSQSTLNLTSESIKGTQDVFSMFTKPQKLTEEEVSISKEKKIYLVCKGKVARSNIFLCPECDTFYCLKCSEALTNLENACWVCETPIDESKPVKLPEKKEEKVVIEGIDLKKSKKK